MAEELQHLIERIQREAVDTGEQQAAKIVTQAKEKAAALIKEAEQKAATIVEKADADARLFTARGEQALSQAARDMLIRVGQGIERIFDQLVKDSVDQALSGSSLSPILERVISTFVKEQGRASSLEVLLGPDDQAALIAHFKSKFAEALKAGLEIRADGRMTRGFKVRLRDRHIEHDFSREAIAEAVSAFLRPALAEMVYKISREQQAVR
ncbi:MAG TPA: hypothetical protein PJ991_07260 [Kiritimatiellia bacterium]|nr:hypothetical protein [Kiritimatiellia bacterium]